MKRTSLVFACILLAAMALSACGPATIVANQAPPQRVLNVNGSGTVNLTPDVAYINIGVHTDMPTASESVSANNTQTQQVIDALTRVRGGSEGHSYDELQHLPKCAVRSANQQEDWNDLRRGQFGLCHGAPNFEAGRFVGCDGGCRAPTA